MFIEIDDKDYEFLKQLQNELRTQTTDCNAKPVFWGVMETHEIGVPEDCGDRCKIRYDEGWMDVEDAVKDVEEVLNEYEPDVRDKWNEVNKEDAYEVCEFMQENLKWDNIYDVVEVRDMDMLSTYTGAFLTKKACQEYIDKYGYNHVRPKTYAMTAVRNYELQRLLNILRSINFLNGNN